MEYIYGVLWTREFLFELILREESWWMILKNDYQWREYIIILFTDGWFQMQHRQIYDLSNKNDRLPSKDYE